MPRDSNSVNVSNSQAVQVGDGNTQNINAQTVVVNNYGTPNACAAPSPHLAKPKAIDHAIAAAYYDRTQLFPSIKTEIDFKSISTLFIAGNELDWHDGLFNRLEHELSHYSEDGAILIEVNWPDDSDAREAKHWLQVLRNMGEGFLGNDISEIKTRILKLAQAQTKNRTNTRIIVQLKLQHPDWGKSDQQLLQALIDGWAEIRETLCSQASNKKKVHVSLLFSVIEEPKAGLRLHFWRKSQQVDINTYPVSKKIKPLFKDALFKALPLVGKQDADAWLGKMQDVYGSDISDNTWWADLAEHIKKLFDDKSLMHHAELKEKFESNDAFKNALKYN